MLRKQFSMQLKVLLWMQCGVQIEEWMDGRTFVAVLCSASMAELPPHMLSCGVVLRGYPFVLDEREASLISSRVEAHSGEKPMKRDWKCVKGSRSDLTSSFLLEHFFDQSSHSNLEIMNIQTVALLWALFVGDSPLAAEMSGRRDTMDAMAGCLEAKFWREFWDFSWRRRRRRRKEKENSMFLVCPGLFNALVLLSSTFAVCPKSTVFRSDTSWLSLMSLRIPMHFL